jgi:polar amino acid transport system substrate-binding protein
MHRRLALALGCALLLTSFAGRLASAEALEQVMEAKKLRVAVPQDFLPFGSVGPDLQPLGYDVDMARLLAEKMGVEAELVPVTSANRIPYLTTGKVDLIISSFGKNPDREKVLDFSAAYAPFYNGVFGPADIEVGKPEDLAGKTLGVTRGSVEDLELSELVPADAVVKRYEDNNSTISAFLSGQVELIATGNVVAAAILARNPKTRPEVKFLVKNSPCYVGLGKGETALLEKVNGAIKEAKASGELSRIAEKWLGEPLPADL